MPKRLSYRRAELLTERLRSYDTRLTWTVSMQVFPDGVHPQVSEGSLKIVWWEPDGEAELYLDQYQNVVVTTDRLVEVV